MKNRKIMLRSGLLAIAIVFAVMNVNAQFVGNNDSAYKAGNPNTGRIWGYAFGDYYYKSHSDSLNRGNNNQYTGIPGSRNAFQIRRLYLGYDYNITKKFAAEVLLAAEDNSPAFNNSASNTTATGDELANNKLSFYIKLANIRWKNIWNGTDLIIGQQATPAFPMLAEKIWSYRSIERTITDIRRTPSYDLGAGLQGFFDPKTKNYGYNFLVANGSGARPAANNFKWFYGDVYAWFLDKKLVVDLYADYQRLNWQPNWHHSRQMIKAYVAYTTPALTIGAEGFINNLANDNKATKIAGGVDTITTKATGISLYVHGNVIKNKLRFFARMDNYNPNKNVNAGIYNNYAGLSAPSAYDGAGYRLTFNPSTGAPSSSTALTDITNKEVFITTGLDFTPVKNVHLMPNIWYNSYASQLSGVSNKDHDLVYRMTFYFTFGK